MHNNEIEKEIGNFFFDSIIVRLRVQNPTLPILCVYMLRGVVV